MYEYQKNNRYFAQTPWQMETFCEEELIEFGAKNIEVAYSGVYFDADAPTLYKINYTSRLLSRVLAPLVSFHAASGNALLRGAMQIEWDNFFSVDETFSITSSVAKSQISNSLYASQSLKDGVADYFRGKYGRRPNVNTVNPDVRLNLRIEKDIALVSIDTSGESLHKRGYRLLAGKAPMPETLAAVIIKISGWDGEKPLWDCMCGSGTIISEALMHYCRIPAQYLRTNFGFFHMPDFDKSAWEKVKKEADEKIRPLPKGLISGSDKSPIAIEVAKENLSRLPYSEAIDLQCRPFSRVEEFTNGILITNPPFGIRIGNIEDVKKLYTELGDFIKQKCTGTTAFIYTGDPSLRKSIGLKTSRRIPLLDGKLEGVLLQIDSYDGSKKRYYQEYKEKGLVEKDKKRKPDQGK